MITGEKLQRLKELLNTANPILITTHWSPDGDAMGSSLGWQRYLQKKGLDAYVVVPNHYPHFLQWMPGAEEVLVFEEHGEKVEELLDKCGLVFALDYNDLSRMKTFGNRVEALKAPKVMIDHHQEPTDFATLSFSEPAASSTAQLVFDVIAAMGDVDLIDTGIAQNLYTGLMTDTGSFRFSSTTAKTHHTIAILLEKGVDPSTVYSAVHDQYSASRMKLVGYCLQEKMEVLEEYGVAITAITEKELKAFHFVPGDTEGVVNMPLSIKGIKVSIFISEQHGEVKLSFRSKGSFAVNTLAKEHFNGGGHINAAGGRSRQSIAQTVQQLKSLIPQYVG